MPKDRRIVFHVEQKQATALKERSRRTGVPVSEILRRALSQPLVGKFFYSVSDDKETIKCQGQIVAEAGPGLYLVQLFEWVMGGESNQEIVPVADMAYWKIFDTAEEMNAAYELYSRRRTSKRAKASQSTSLFRIQVSVALV
jgi:hypothetical protein